MFLFYFSLHTTSQPRWNITWRRAEWFIQKEILLRELICILVIYFSAPIGYRTSGRCRNLYEDSFSFSPLNHIFYHHVTMLQTIPRASTKFWLMEMWQSKGRHVEDQGPLTVRDPYYSHVRMTVACDPAFRCCNRPKATTALYLRLHGIEIPPPNGFSRNFVFEICTNVCYHLLLLVKIGRIVRHFAWRPQYVYDLVLSLVFTFERGCSLQV